MIGGDDFTIRGGAYTAVGLRKGQYADELAIRRRIPVVRLLEGGGASVTGASGVRGRSGYDLTASSPLNLLCMEALATVPVVCAALGPVAGFPAARLVASHFSLMTRETAQVLTGGPTLVERALGESSPRRSSAAPRSTCAAASCRTSPRTNPTPGDRSARFSPTCRPTSGRPRPCSTWEIRRTARRRS